MSDAPTAPPGLFILGMHRSGTSCLAGMLESAGFNAGEVDEWNPDNPRGNREHLAVTPLNEGLLRARGGSWDQPPDHVDVDERQHREMQSIVAGLEAVGRPWFIKDPRILLLPEPWLALRPDARRLGIFRHPLAVARSLERRDGLSLEQGVELWTRYNRGLLQLLDDAPFPLLLFSTDSGRLVEATAAVLAERFGDQVRRQELQPDRLASFFEGDLVHHAPEFALDIAPALRDAGVSDAAAGAANALWQELVARQDSEPQCSEESAAGDEAPDADLRTSGKPGSASPANESGVVTMDAERRAPATLNLDDESAVNEAIETGGDPIGLFRARIRHLEAGGATEALRTWLAGWVERRPDDPFLYWELAKTEWRLGAREAALEHAQAATRLAPGWAEPLGKLAEWAWAAEAWPLAAESYRALYAAHRSVTRDPDLVAQLFFDRGAGFSADACVTVPLEGRGGAQDLRFVPGPDTPGHDGDLRRLRFDPVNATAVVAGLDLFVVDDQGDETPLPPIGDNALFLDGGTRYFETDDPQVFFDVEDGSAVSAVRVRFELRHVDDDARAATFQTLLALRERVARSDDDTPLAMLEQRRKAFEDALAEVRGSVSGRLGAAVTRTLMNPASLGRGETGLSRLAEAWNELDEALQALLDHRTD